MKINIEQTGSKRYLTAKVEINGGVFDLGLLNEDECMDLARELNTAVYDLLGKDKYKELVNEE